MADNAQKTPIQHTLNRWADGKINSAQALLGKAVPASALSVDATGTIVTVKLEVQQQPFTFPEVTCPVYGPQWVRWPIQPGDPGVCFPADYYMGGMSGLGDGVASLSQMMNLGTLVWFPIGNTNFGDTDNPNAVVIYGPDGTIIRDRDKKTAIQCDGAGNTQNWGNLSYSWDVGGYGQRITKTGSNTWKIDNYVTGAVVTTNTLPINPPRIPQP